MLSFATSLFFVACIGEFLRRGSLDIPPFMALCLMGAAMTLAALAILGRDARRLFLAPKADQYGSAGLQWSWRRSGRLMLVVPVFLAITICFAAPVANFLWIPPTASGVASALVVQIVVIALAQELFFREAVLKVFAGNLRLAFAISAGAALVFHLPHGLPTAITAASMALALMALRVKGMNLFVLAAVHGSTSVLFGRILVPQIAPDTLWPYAAAVAMGHIAFAAALMARRRDPVAAPQGIG